MLSPFGAAFRLDGAPQKPGILGGKLAELPLHVVDDAALFEDLVSGRSNPIGRMLMLAGTDEVVENIAVIGIDGVAPDTGLARERRDSQAPG